MQGGLVVPYVSARHRQAGRALLGTNHPLRRRRCLTRPACGVCGQDLTDDPRRAFVLIARPVDIGRSVSAEPAMHPECAAYAAAACPLLNGSRSHYRRQPIDLTAERCGDRLCDCRYWMGDVDVAARAGSPAPPFYQVRLPLAAYAARNVNSDASRDRSGVVIDLERALAVRLVTAGTADVLEAARVLMLGLPPLPYSPI
jgi:hypothetical protein